MFTFPAVVTFLVITIILFVIWKFRKVSTYTDGYGKTRTSGKNLKILFGWATIGSAILTVLFFGIGSFYSQPEGTAQVQVSINGKAITATTDAGFHAKWPWVSTVEFNIRNQAVAFGGSEQDFQNNQGDGYKFDGPQVTLNAKDGVPVNQDLQVTYSIKPNKVLDTYNEWKTEDAFKSGLIYQDIRNTAREEANTRDSSLQLLTGIASFGSDIDKALKTKWIVKGIEVNQVNLQQPRLPESVTNAYAEAQKAEINVTTEKNNLEAAKISAQKQVVEAQAQADANEKLSKSLTPAILKQRTIDMLSKANTIVVPQDFTALGNIGALTK